MSDDKSNAGGQDRQRINVNQDYELRDWARSLNTTPERVKEAVQAVAIAVRLQLVLLAVQREPAVGDAVGKPADEGTHARLSLEHTLERVVAQRHVVELSVAIRHEDLQDLGAEIAEAHAHAGAVAQREQARGLAADHAFEIRRIHSGKSWRRTHRPILPFVLQTAEPGRS